MPVEIIGDRIMDRRRFLQTASVGLLARPFVSEAQVSAQTRRIGVIRFGSPPDPVVEQLRRGLNELGYIEHKNIVIEYRWVEGDRDQIAAVVGELVRLKAEVIVVPHTTAARIAKEVTTTTPIVVVAGGSMVEGGLVASLSRPGGNITGSAMLLPEVSAKAVELFKQAVPACTRMAVLRAGLAPFIPETQALQTATKSLGIEVRQFAVRDPVELQATFAAMRKEQVQGLFVFADPSFSRYLGRITELAAGSRLPSSSHSREFVDAGGLIAYWPSRADLGRQAARFVDKILRGSRPGDLPIEQPMKFELGINLKTAKALGLTIPPSVLTRADYLIE